MPRGACRGCVTQPSTSVICIPPLLSHLFFPQTDLQSLHSPTHSLCYPTPTCFHTHTPQRQVVLSVALGVGTGTALGLLKVILQWPLMPMLLPGYALVSLCVCNYTPVPVGMYLSASASASASASLPLPLLYPKEPGGHRRSRSLTC